ncbi:hypothetical protein SAMN05660284_00465 [Formivibrio citricus]|uniref:Uncharacterized protein n=1 Tax=Formivibrio citricus TaxID=83765 RepID=A0A1I4W0V4_9NEIS|nr:hypothetical protein [Formivibrio citricus]SFN06789.1 hypothetical protein SAMN05660284_00465 [Formivibrio citricus]
MLLRWIAGIALFGALTLGAHAEEKDAPLPFDDPAAAPQVAKKKPVKTTQSRKKASVKSGKKKAVTPATAHQVKQPKKRVGTKKAGVRKAGKKKKR